jgi:predicted DNA-binding protein
MAESEKNYRDTRKGWRIYSIMLSEELYNKLEELSKKYGIPKSQIVKEAIIEKILRLEKLENQQRGDG